MAGRETLAKLSNRYKVVRVKRKSKARYAFASVGDVITITCLLRDTTGGSNGNYALDFEVKVGYTTGIVSQNEVTKLFDIYELEEIR